MRRKYRDCQREDGNCSICSLVNYGRDCHNNPITKIELERRSAGLTQKELSQKSGVEYRKLLRIEAGEVDQSRITVLEIKNLAKALDIDVNRLIEPEN